VKLQVELSERGRAGGLALRTQFEPTRLPEVVLIKPRVFGDARGFFFESWHREKCASAGIDARFVQDNHSHSVRHTLQGCTDFYAPQHELAIRWDDPEIGIRWPLSGVIVQYIRLLIERV
jgi:dTDP-4-dehydrorhamnose 3,5-epimerase-like enzyme